MLSKYSISAGSLFFALIASTLSCSRTIPPLSTAQKEIASWKPLGEGPKSSDNFGNRSVIGFNSKLYAIWTEKASVRAAYYNEDGGRGVWQPAESPGSSEIGSVLDPNYPTFVRPGFFIFNSKLYAYWVQLLPHSMERVRISAYNGDEKNPTWTSVVDEEKGLTGILDSVGWVSFAVFESKLYAIWIETDIFGGESTGGAIFDGTRWTNFVSESPKDLGGKFSRPQLVVWNSKLYAFMQNAVARYEGGTKWSYHFFKSTTEPGWSAVVSMLQFTVFNSKLYVAWTQSNQDDKVADKNSESCRLFQNRIAVLGTDAKTLAPDTLIYVDDESTRKTFPQWLRPPVFAEHGSKLYTAWFEARPQGVELKTSVYKGNDGDPQWSAVGASKVENIDFGPPILVSTNSKLYAVWFKQIGPRSTQLQLSVGE